MNCYKCKHPNLHGSNFCEKCGADLKAPPPKITPVRPYGGYGSPPPMSSPVGYGPPVRPTPAPKPVPAPRPAPAGSRPAPPTPPPQPPRQERVPRRSPVISPREPARPSPTPRATPREPLPFGRLTGPGGLEFSLRYDRNLIGRASPGEGIEPQVDLSAADRTGTVSRRHARIGKDDAAIFIEDLGSSNGTRHNGQTLREGMQSPLSDGDQVIFGDLVFTFSLTGDR